MVESSLQVALRLRTVEDLEHNVLFQKKKKT